MILSASQIAEAEQAMPPDDLVSLRDRGFWIEPRTFPFRPLDLVPYLDDGTEPVGRLATPAVDPEQWIDNWGLAAFEARIAIKAVEDDANRPVFVHRPPKQQNKGLGHHCDLMEQERPELLKALKRFVAEAEQHDPVSPVDIAKREGIFQIRHDVADKLDSFAVKYALESSDGSTYWHLVRQYLHDNGPGLSDDVPDAYRGFLSTQISCWKGHRLFGRTVPAITDFPDLRGLDCVVSILSHHLMATQTEHENGFSIWCERAKMAQGDYSAGRFVMHTNV